MKEIDLKPLELIRENHILRNIDVESFVPGHLQEVCCPACDSKEYRESFNKGRYHFLRCLSCDTLYVSPRPSSRDLARFYSNAQYMRHWNDKIFPSTEKVRRGRDFLLIERILKYVHTNNQKVAVDVGAGHGIFCDELKFRKVFSEVVAIEPSIDLARTCRERGIRTVEKNVEDVEPEELGEVSLITGIELIEHLYCPRDFVAASYRLLSKDGLLVLTTPNIKGFDLMVLQKCSENIIAPIHLTYFHPRSIRILLESCGLEVVEILTPGELDADIVRNQVLAGKFDISDNQFLKHVLIDNWDAVGSRFQTFLRDNLISSHMMIVARKCLN